MMSELDLLLYRPIKDGKKFEKLIPDSACESTYLGKGMTDFSVTNMADWVKQYAWQMQEVAPLMNGKTLSQTCGNIHAFTYDHFQYKADLEDQYLRSPACSWHVRYDGIDCKSYSILASCILVNQGISHYIRRVKQPALNPDLWSHVYVIVPNDQKGFDLGKGYYVIDGTVPTDNETIYTEKSDLFMSGMKHYGLRAAYGGLNASADTWAKIKGIFGSGWDLSCIGGTLDMAEFNQMATVVVAWFDAQFKTINTNVAANSPDVMRLINKLLTNTQQIAEQGARYKRTSWSSSCSKKAASAYNDLGQYYADIVLKAFLAWLENYFNVTYTTIGPVMVGGFEPATPNFGKATTVSMTGLKNIASIQLKSNVSTIYGFELTPYALDKNNYTASLNVPELLNGMKTVIASFDVKNNANGTTETYVDDTIKDINGNKTPQTAGMGVTGWILVALALGGIAKVAMDSNKPVRANKTTAKTTK